MRFIIVFKIFLGISRRGKAVEYKLSHCVLFIAERVNIALFRARILRKNLFLHCIASGGGIAVKSVSCLYVRRGFRIHFFKKALESVGIHNGRNIRRGHLFLLAYTVGNGKAVFYFLNGEISVSYAVIIGIV